MSAAGSHPTGPSRAALREALAPLGRRSAYSWPVAAVFLAITTAKQLASDATALGGPFESWLVASALSALVFAGVFAAVGALIRRVPEPSPSAVLAGYGLAGAARAFSIGLATSLTGLADEAFPGFRLVAVATNALILAVTGYVVGRHDRHRAVLAEIERHRRRAVEAERLAATELELTRAELAGALRASLEPAVRSLDAALIDAAAAGGQASRALDQLERLVEDEVRPLSHRLASERVEVREPEPDAAIPTLRVPLPARYRIADGIRPGLTVLLVGVAGLGTAVRDLEGVEVLEYLAAALGIIWALQLLLQRGLRSREMPALPGVALLSLLDVAFTWVGLRLIAAAGIPQPQAMLVIAPLAVGLIGGLVAFGDVVEVRRAATEAERAAVVGRLEEATALATRRGRLARVQLARIVHGTLQGELYAAAMRLRETPRPSAAIFTGVRAAVAGALAHLEQGAAEGGRTHATLDALVATWEGLRAITAQVDARAGEALAADPIADEAVAEVVREAVNNALRHGRAQSVAIEVALVRPDGSGAVVLTPGMRSELSVRVRDDGVGWTAGAGAGQGSALFDELCRAWSHASDERGTTFSGVIPVG